MKMWEGGRSRLGLLIHEVHQTKKDDGKCCEWDSKCQW